MSAFGRCALAVLVGAAVAFLPGKPAGAADITITPSHDNSLFEDNGNRSCGIGPLFCGRTNFFLSRRVVISFDVASSVPAGSTITGVEFGLNVELAGPGAQASDLHNVHRIRADWGEESSTCSDGVGALAEPGDATWTHRHFATDAWSAGGGDFDAIASGSTAMPTLGPASFASQPGMVANVQSWLDLPSDNFGWIVIGNEAAPASARKFGSRESSLPPSLHIVFTPPPVPPPAVPDGTKGSPVLLSKLSADGANLGVSWDDTLCSGGLDHHIVFGTGTGFPSAPAAPFALQGSVCDLGASSPFVWSGSPDPVGLDPMTRLMWFLVLAGDDVTTEGSWGESAPGAERNGPGTNGCSGQCDIIDKNVSNTCGNGF